MSAFLFIAGTGPVAHAGPLAQADPGGKSGLAGTGLEDGWRGPGAECRLIRCGWEVEPEPASRSQVVRAHGLVGVADASLYHRGDLVRALEAHGIPPEGETSSHLLVAAFRAWGPDCIRHLEGDFAFAIWDPAAGSLFAARDPSGLRALFMSPLPEGLALSSTPLPLLELLGPRRRLSPAGILRVLTFRDGDGTDTVWEGIQEVPAGHVVRFRAGAAPMLSRWPSLPRDPGVARLGDDEAVREARRLLVQACAERIPASGGTAVAMSGGYDSTAIYAALRHAAEAFPVLPRTRVVTAAFPPGDPGNEDAYVREVLAFWQDTAEWVQVEGVPVADPGGVDPDRFPGPHRHHFHGMNRALARAAHGTGARVLFHGMLGDELFDTSPVYLADLLREGRWVELRREWKAFQLRGRRAFRRYCIRPLLPDWAVGLRHALGEDRPAPHPLGAPLPPWISGSALHASGIVERDAEIAAAFRGLVRGRAGRSASRRERLASLLRPEPGRMSALIRAVAGKEGVELRGPFFDRRLMAFVLSRPREDLVRSGETKVLLRRAMEGLLPPRVLAPRPEITGSPEAYFLRSLRAEVPALAEGMEHGAALGDLGLIEPGRFRYEVQRFLEGHSRFALSILHTLQTERWLRDRAARWDSPSGSTLVPGNRLPRSA